MKAKIDKCQTICLYKGTIIVKYALDFTEKSLYNDRKVQYIILKEDINQWQEK